MRDPNADEIQDVIEVMEGLLHEVGVHGAAADQVEELAKRFIREYRQILIGVEGHDEMRPNFTTLLRGLTVKKRIKAVLVFKAPAGRVVGARFVRDNDEPEKIWFAAKDDYRNEKPGDINDNNKEMYGVDARLVDVWERDAAGKWPQRRADSGVLTQNGRIALE